MAGGISLVRAFNTLLLVKLDSGCAVLIISITVFSWLNKSEFIIGKLRIIPNTSHDATSPFSPMVSDIAFTAPLRTK